MHQNPSALPSRMPHLGSGFVPSVCMMRDSISRETDSDASSTIIDAPLVRPGFVREKEEMRQAIQSAEVARHQVVDFRRGLDLLLSRGNVDPKRVAYVGHSFDAHVGSILTAV